MATAACTATSSATATWKSTCLASGRRNPGHDRLDTRHFQFVLVLRLPTLLVCAMRRVACPHCGMLEVENLPWPTASSSRKRPSVGSLPVGQASRVAGHGPHLRQRLGHDASRRRDGRGLEPRPDQSEWRHSARRRRGRWPVGQRYFTPVYQLDASRRRLRVGEEHKIETLESFFKWFATECAGQALHVLNRFHVAGNLGG